MSTHDMKPTPKLRWYRAYAGEAVGTGHPLDGKRMHHDPVLQQWWEDPWYSGEWRDVETESEE